jgi:hypothetical protein
MNLTTISFPWLARPTNLASFYIIGYLLQLRIESGDLKNNIYIFRNSEIKTQKTINLRQSQKQIRHLAKFAEK